jgi:lysylphosphatidylglycerol synthetase-like protein (DUF2156 family)
MGSVTTILARGSLALGGVALIAIGITHTSLPQHIWLESGVGSHILGSALLANILILACPFRRRNDLALALTIVLMGIDLSAHVPLKITFADAAGAGLTILQIWTERRRAGARDALTERRRSAIAVSKAHRQA